MCPFGTYRNGLNLECDPCPAGTWSGGAQGLKSLDECSPCPAGKVCETDGISSLSAMRNCSAGFMCPEGTA